MSKKKAGEGWRSEKDFKRYGKVLEKQLLDLGKWRGGSNFSHVRKAIPLFKKYPRALLQRYNDIGNYVKMYGAEVSEDQLKDFYQE